MLVITAQASNASEVILFYRTRPDIVFEELLMNDEGIDGDALAGDGIFSSQFLFQGRDVDYYIYAENDSAGAFSPQRAAYEYFTIEGQLNAGDIVINELMASNVDVVADADGSYEDWIELLNTTENELSLGGLYLSDDATNLSKWALPNQELPGVHILLFGQIQKMPKDQVMPTLSFHRPESLFFFLMHTRC